MKKVKIEIICDADYACESLHDLAEYIENETDMNFSKMPPLCGGHYTADFFAVKKNK